jgi:hypothetical protein
MDLVSESDGSNDAISNAVYKTYLEVVPHSLKTLTGKP